jgi:hypothetical protein
MIERSSWVKPISVSLTIAFLGALLAFAYVGRFTRYMADDYCIAVELQHDGFMKAQTIWYTTWTGKFSLMFALSVAELIGPAIVPFLPLLALIVWLAGTIWSVNQIALMAKWPRPLTTSFLLSGFVIFATLNSAHNLVQSFYWQTGMLGYMPPLIFLTISIGLLSYVIRRRLQDRPALLLVMVSAVMTVFAGGLSEVYAVLQTGALLLALIAFWIFPSPSLKRAALFPLVANLTGSLIGLLVVALAPGNYVRQSSFLPPPHLIALIRLSLFNTAGFVGYTIYLAPLTTLLMVLLPALFGGYVQSLHSKPTPDFDSRTVRRLLRLLPVIGFVLLFICFVPGVYATSGMIPERARIIPQFVFILTTAVWSYFAGMALLRRFSVRLQTPSPGLTAGFVVIAVLLFLPPLVAIRRTLKLVPGASASALAWDQDDREIRAAKARGLMDLTIPVAADVESRLGARRTELQIQRDPQDWKNRCMADYYGINSIKAQ